MKLRPIAECVSFTMSSLTPSGQNVNAVCFSSQQDELKVSKQPEHHQSKVQNYLSYYSGRP